MPKYSILRIPLDNPIAEELASELCGILWWGMLRTLVQASLSAFMTSLEMSCIDAW